MKILLPVDGSSHTKRMLAWLVTHDEWLAQPHHYTVVHVVPQIPPHAASMFETQLLKDRPKRDTLEIRILPGAIDAAEIVNRAALVELLLDRCEEPFAFPIDPAADVSALMEVMAETLAERD